MNRPLALGGVRRPVIKIGSAVLRDGLDFDRVTFASLVRGVVALRAHGLEPVIVCSGAVALGMPPLGITARPDRIEILQATAAVGQGRLMRMWADELGHYGAVPAQVLLTHDDLRDRRRFLAARHTLRALLELGAVPVINENDTVATEEIKMGDNDLLSSQVVSLVEGQLLVILSDVEGFYAGDPRAPGAQPEPWVECIDDRVLGLAGGSTTGLGSGGMRTKLEAVRQVNRLGVPALIARGKTPQVLRRLYAGEDLGTWFAADPAPIGRRKHWIAYALRPAGTLRVDAGAVEALLRRGRSLLPIGITAVEGDFGPGETVRIVDPEGAELARGLVGHDAATLRALAGRRSADGDGLDRAPPEAVHRDDLVLLRGPTALPESAGSPAGDLDP